MNNWQKSENIIDEMIKGSNGTLWGVKLEQSDHFPILLKAFEFIGETGLLLDIGCGAGDVNRAWKGDYLGVDLDWVIENVAKKCNVDKNYISMEITPQNISLLPKADVVLMNAFLDIQTNPHDIFNAVLKHDSKKIIIHRQRLQQNMHAESIETQISYANTEIPSSIMSANKLYCDTKELFPNAAISLLNWANDWYTIIIEKN